MAAEKGSEIQRGLKECETSRRLQLRLQFIDPCTDARRTAKRQVTLLKILPTKFRLAASVTDSKRAIPKFLVRYRLENFPESSEC